MSALHVSCRRFGTDGNLFFQIRREGPATAPAHHLIDNPWAGAAYQPLVPPYVVCRPRDKTLDLE